MNSPLHHSPGERNRRKALKHAEDLLEALEFLHADHVKRIAEIQYSIGRAVRLINRLHSEVEPKP